MKYTITGATGKLGTQIVQALIKLVPVEQLNLGVHTLRKAQGFQQQGLTVTAIDYQNPASLAGVLAASDVFIYVPSKSHDAYSRVSEFENVVHAAETSGVKHLLVMGFIADQVNNPFDLSAFYGYVPRRLAASQLDYTIIRNALYADPLVPYLPELIARKNVIYPMGDQALSFISQADSAAAFAKVATTPQLLQTGRIYTLTQAQSYTMPALATVLSAVSGHEIGYQPLPLAEFAALYNQNNEGSMLASMYAGGAQGLLSEVSADYELIMGQPAQSLPAFLQTHLT
ncbi:NAD(P)-dependent oxidoreductase [Lactobacillus sp. CBA3606]|uniref:SDR family oxidoreductase n=1 Tax=Lactobacillus sp. CBA3606 TaxID=2099789 RepID=UPI000CFD2FA0|nr:SDR family oxidoreductase [Lactobacillus sp. CBA3606]AVK63863.1 NAD(P)-dependent oxidoreductase [Lactobacillus sp. CBA3606]